MLVQGYRKVNQFSMYIYKTHTYISFKLDIVLDLLRIALIFKKLLYI